VPRRYDDDEQRFQHTAELSSSQLALSILASHEQFSQIVWCGEFFKWPRITLGIRVPVVLDEFKAICREHERDSLAPTSSIVLDLLQTTVRRSTFVLGLNQRD